MAKSAIYAWCSKFISTAGELAARIQSVNIYQSGHTMGAYTAADSRFHACMRPFSQGGGIHNSDIH